MAMNRPVSGVTPGTTKPMKAGDVVDVEIEGVGILRNKTAK